MNTMEITKIVAGLCAALLVFLLINFFSEFLYAGESHGEDGVEAYIIATGEGEAETEEEVEQEVDFAAIMANADAAAGEAEFKPCAACHKLEAGANGVGPSLYGVVGRDVASADGFSFSDAMTGVEGDWTPEHLNAFLTNPKEEVPGTKMVFKGIRDIQDRANLIAYLDSLDN